jgi:wobble nucleotide-excising tRNase
MEDELSVSKLRLDSHDVKLVIALILQLLIGTAVLVRYGDSFDARISANQAAITSIGKLNDRQDTVNQAQDQRISMVSDTVNSMAVQLGRLDEKMTDTKNSVDSLGSALRSYLSKQPNN